MRLIKCPLCDVKGHLEIKKRYPKIEGTVECPVCSGKGKIYEIKQQDIVDVEIFHKGTEDEYALIHRHDAVLDSLVDETLSIGEVSKKYKDIVFCENCFGKYVVYENKIMKTD